MPKSVTSFIAETHRPTFLTPQRTKNCKPVPASRTEVLVYSETLLNRNKADLLSTRVDGEVRWTKATSKKGKTYQTGIKETELRADKLISG